MVASSKLVSVILLVSLSRLRLIKFDNLLSLIPVNLLSLVRLALNFLHSLSRLILQLESTVTVPCCHSIAEVSIGKYEKLVFSFEYLALLLVSSILEPVSEIISSLPLLTRCSAWIRR